MLTVEKRRKNDELIFCLSGELDESADLMAIFGGVPPSICINSRYVTRVSPAGVQKWIRFFDNYRRSGVAIKHVECSSAMTRQIRAISAGVDQVETVMGAFSCQKCPNAFEVPIKVGDIQSIKAQVTEKKCPACGGASAFRENIAEYFSFLI